MVSLKPEGFNTKMVGFWDDLGVPHDFEHH